MSYNEDGRRSASRGGAVGGRKRADSTASSWLDASSRLVNSLYKLSSASVILHPLSDDGMSGGWNDEERTCPTVLAGWNVLNLIQGIGILGIPYAVALGGLPSLFIIALVAGLTCYTGKLLVRCLYAPQAWMSSKPYESVITESQVDLLVTRLPSYASVGEHVWPSFGHELVNSVSLVEMFGALVLYLILLAKMSATLLVYTTFLPVEVLLGQSVEEQFCAVISGLATLPLLLFTRLNIISWFSVIAVLALFLLIILVMLYCGMYASLINWQNLLIAPSAGNVAISLGIIVFSFCAHAVFPSIEGTMKHPSSFGCMMDVSFVIAALVKIVFGGLAVLIFGANTQQEITTNFFNDPNNSVFPVIICVLVLINVFFSTPMVAYIICERIDLLFWPQIQPLFQSVSARMSTCAWWCWVVITRICLLLAALFASLMVPEFALLMSFIGSLTGSLLSFILPAAFYLQIYWVQMKIYHKVGICLIPVFGIIITVLGMLFSGERIAKTFSIFQPK